MAKLDYVVRGPNWVEGQEGNFSHLYDKNDHKRFYDPEVVAKVQAEIYRLFDKLSDGCLDLDRSLALFVLLSEANPTPNAWEMGRRICQQRFDQLSVTFYLFLELAFDWTGLVSRQLLECTDFIASWYLNELP